MAGDTNKLSADLKIKVFMWIIGGVAGVGILALTYVNGKLDTTTQTFNHNVTQIKVDVSAIQSDISWIKDNLE